MDYSSPLPFELGETLSGTDDDGNLINLEVIGKLFVMTASNVGNQRIATRLAGRQLLAMPMRNVIGAAALGKRLVRFQRPAAGGFRMVDSFDGYTDTLAEKGFGVLDEYLPTAGVADDDIAWVILKGPVTVLTPMVGAAFSLDIPVGGQLVAATSTTTGATTAGRMSNFTLAGQTAATAAFNMAANILGTAMSARTTGETDADLLINAQINY